MNILDMRTVILLSVITYITCTLFIVQLWRQNRDRFAGLAFWVFQFVLLTAALALIAMRGVIPAWMSIVLANTMIIAGALAGYMGLERFVGKKGPQIHNYILLALNAGAFVYATFIHPDLNLRILIVSVCLLIIFFQCLWLLWRRVKVAMRPLTFAVGMVFGGYCVASIARIVEYFVGAHAGGKFFQSGDFQALINVAYLMLLILLTYSLIMMVNRRLRMEIGTQEEKFAKAFHSAPYAITLTRLSDGTIVDVNDTFVSITGYDRAEVMGKKTVDLHIWEHDEDRATVVDALLRKGRVHGEELRFLMKNGEARTGLFSAEVIEIDGEKSVLSSISDITDRKVAEERIGQLQEYLKLQIDRMPIGLIVWDTEFRVTSWNPAAEKIFGFTAQEALGKHPYGLIVPKEAQPHVDDIWGRLLEGDITAHSINDNITKDGRTIICQWSNTPLKEADGTVRGVLSMVQDITDRKVAEEALRRAHEELETRVQERTAELASANTSLQAEIAERRQAEEQLEATVAQLRDTREQLVRGEKLAVLGQLAGGVAHELRNPLGVMSNAIYYLSSISTDADETTREYLEMISSEVGNAEGIVSDLLDFSHTRSLEQEEVTAAELVARVLQKRPPPEKVKVTTAIPPELPPVFVDPRQIGQVLGNLIANAYQAMAAGGNLTISAQAEKQKVSLFITDTGCGISKENMQKIFEPLFTTRSRGIGLGLAVSRDLVELNGGSIEVQSPSTALGTGEEGQGSTFTVKLPTK